MANDATVLTLSADIVRLCWSLRSISRSVSGVSGVGGGNLKKSGPFSLLCLEGVATGPRAVDTEEADEVDGLRWC